MDDRGMTLLNHAETILLGVSVLVGLVFWALYRNSALGKAHSWEYPEDTDPR